MATNFGGKMTNFPHLLLCRSETGMGYRYLNVRINGVNYVSISCKNFMNFGPAVLNFWYDTAKTGVISRISQDVLNQFLETFHRMKALWVQMIDLDLVFRFVK